MTGEAGRPPRIVAFGDSAHLVVLGDRADPIVRARTRAMEMMIEAGLAAKPGWGTPVLGHASVLVPHDPELLTGSAARAALEELATTAVVAEPTSSARLVEIAVRYGGPNGPDLDAVSGRLGLEPAEVVRLHAGTDYDVLVVGFAPGFAYLGPLAEALRLPRRETPRPRVPAGSVAIAADQTAVYPLESPGGWHLIGRTDEVMWDVRRDPPARLEPGDRVRFVPVG